MLLVGFEDLQNVFTNNSCNQEVVTFELYHRFVFLFEIFRRKCLRNLLVDIQGVFEQLFEIARLNHFSFEWFIQIFHYVVEKRTKHISFDGFFYFVGLLHFFYFGKIKLQRTVDVSVDRTCRECRRLFGIGRKALNFFHYSRRFLYLYGLRTTKANIERNVFSLIVDTIMIVQLVHKAAYFTSLAGL